VAEAPDDGDGAPAPGGANEAAMDDTTFALTLLGIVLAGVGLMVLLLSWLARALVRRPWRSSLTISTPRFEPAASSGTSFP